MYYLNAKLVKVDLFVVEAKVMEEEKKTKSDMYEYCCFFVLLKAVLFVTVPNTEVFFTFHLSSKQLYSWLFPVLQPTEHSPKRDGFALRTIRKFSAYLTRLCKYIQFWNWEFFHITEYQLKTLRRDTRGKEFMEAVFACSWNVQSSDSFG